MSTVGLDEPSAYLGYLPGIYQQGADKGSFIARYLKIFEKFLSGIDDASVSKVSIEGLEQVVARLHEFFDPEFTPKEFLEWLAGWMALALRDDWDEPSKRRLMRRIIPLYKKRGTKGGLTEYLRIFVGDNVRLDDLADLTVGNTSHVGIDTFVGGLLPHFFIVTVTFSTIGGLGFIQDTVAATKAVLDLEKPAHTYYALRLDFPGMYVGHPPRTTTMTQVGVNTIIGSGYPFFV